MDQHEKFRQTVKRLDDARTKLVEANRLVTSAEGEVDQAKNSLARTLRAVFGDTPALYAGSKYELNDDDEVVTSSICLTIVREAP